MSRYFPNGCERGGAGERHQLLRRRGRPPPFVQLLRKAGPNPTREGLIRAARNWNQVNPFLLPNNPQQTTAKNQFPIRGFRMVRFNNGTFTYISPMIYPRGQT